MTRPRTCLYVGGAFLEYGGADGDCQVHVVVEAPYADGAAVDAAFARFDFFDDFHGADFGSAGKCACRESGGKDIHVGHTVFQTAFDVGDDVHHMGVFFNHHFVGDFDFSSFTDAADVVAS